MDSNSERKSTESRRSGNKLLGVGLAGVLVVVAFFAGLNMGGGSFGSANQEANIFSFFTTSAQPDQEASLGEFWRVWNLLDKKFVTSSTSTPSLEERMQGAISGMVRSYGDPYTVYLPPEDAEAFAEEISGNFSGVGMEVGMRDQMITVIAPLPDSPAKEAGVLAGDVVVKIDGTSTEGMGIDKAVKLIRGEKGTEVTLSVYREGEGDFLDITIVRDVINIPTLETEVADDVFVVKLYSFNALAESKMQKAMKEYQDGDYDKMILDLRGNPGGFLESAVSIAGYFLPTGKVVVRESFGDDREEQVYRTSGHPYAKFTPDNLVVLMDGGSASASEILAGALSEHGVATTIGETTFGKGSVQELVDLPDGSSLKVTIARWLTPEGVSFSEGGLEPNISVTRTSEQVMAGEDTQRQAALDWLDGKRDVGDKLGFEF